MSTKLNAYGKRNNDVMPKRKNRTKPFYPECEKLQEVAPKTQVIMEFLEWLNSNKKMLLATYHEHTVECENEKLFPKYGCGYNENELTQFMGDVQPLLAEFFKIDLKKVEEERQQILNEIKVANKQK